jgi:hypothetical protein
LLLPLRWERYRPPREPVKKYSPSLTRPPIEIGHSQFRRAVVSQDGGSIGGAHGRPFKAPASARSRAALFRALYA